jgi:hypothetical protein
MLTLLLISTIGCDIRAQSYGYAAPAYSYSYAAPAKVYYQATYAAPAYQAPQYNYQSLVGQYLREEQAYKAQLDQNNKLDQLIQIFRQQATAPPPQFQAPPPVYQQPPAPPKATPQSYQSPPVPTPQAPAPADAPPPPPAPGKVVPSFSSVAPISAPAGLGAMAVLQNRCLKCHAAETYAQKGGGFKMTELDGTLAQDFSTHGRDILDAVLPGRMPKGGPRLGGSEVAAIYDGLQRLAQAQAQAAPPIAGAFGGD